MEKSYQPLQTVSIEAGAALAYPNRFVKMSSGKLAYCGANGKALGVLALEVDAAEIAPVHVNGIVLIEVGTGGVTENTYVTSDASGKAIAIAALSATATLSNAVIPSGATPVTSSGAQPALTMTQPAVALAGGVLPIAVNGLVLDTGVAGSFVRVLL